jgi:hypothetical protein
MLEAIDHDGPFVHRWRGAAAPVARITKST